MPRRWRQRAYVLLNLARAGEALDGHRPRPCRAADGGVAAPAPRHGAALPRTPQGRARRRRERRSRAPLDLGVRLELARCQLVARKRKDAVQTAAAIVADHPASVAAWIVVGETRLGRDNAGAADAYRRALAIDPTSAAATNGLGAAYQALGKRREAAEMYTQAARLAPHATAPRRNLEQLVGFGGLGCSASSCSGSPSSPRTALAVAAILAALAVPVIVVVRRRRLAVLPPDARAFVESQRRARWRKLRDPRTWPGWVRANPRPLASSPVHSACSSLAATFGSDRRDERNPRLDFDLEDFEVPTICTRRRRRPSSCAVPTARRSRFVPAPTSPSVMTTPSLAGPPVQPVVSEVGSSPDAGQDRGSATAP